MLMTEKDRELIDAMQALWESVNAADGDLGGDQREWHLPRLQKVLTTLTKQFPSHSTEGFSKAESPYGGLISDD